MNLFTNMTGGKTQIIPSKESNEPLENKLIKWIAAISVKILKLMPPVIWSLCLR
jgi:hypothetical protein